MDQSVKSTNFILAVGRQYIKVSILPIGISKKPGSLLEFKVAFRISMYLCLLELQFDLLNPIDDDKLLKLQMLKAQI